MRRHYQNVERIIAVARQLGELAQKVVFAGGAATGLLITDPAFSDVRPTIDIDVMRTMGTSMILCFSSKIL